MGDRESGRDGGPASREGVEGLPGRKPRVQPVCAGHWGSRDGHRSGTASANMRQSAGSRDGSGEAVVWLRPEPGEEGGGLAQDRGSDHEEHRRGQTSACSPNRTGEGWSLESRVSPRFLTLVPDRWWSSSPGRVVLMGLLIGRKYGTEVWLCMGSSEQREISTRDGATVESVCSSPGTQGSEAQR